MKNSYKRFLSLLLTLVMLCSLVPAAFADETEEAASAEPPVVAAAENQAAVLSAAPATPASQNTEAPAPAAEPAAEENNTPAETSADETAPVAEPAEELATETSEEETLSEEKVTNAVAAAVDLATCEHSYSVNNPGVCELCGAAHTEHTYGKYSKDMAAYRISAADCEHAAVYYKRCTVCYASAKTSTIKEKTFTYGDPLGHTLVAVEAKEPTCASGNIAYWQCSVCDKLFSDENGTEETTIEDVTIPPVKDKHGPLTVVEKVDATSEKDGNIAYFRCDTCGELFLDADGFIEVTAQTVISHHLVAVEAVAPTCTDDGNIAYWTCTNCGRLFLDSDAMVEVTAEQIVDRAVGHIADYIEKIDATCTEGGMEAFWICSVCGKMFSDEACTVEIAEPVVIPATGHKNPLMKCDAIEPTKKLHGNIEYYYCEDCGLCFLDDEGTIEVSFEDCILHNLKKTKAKKATCTEDGNNEYYTCTVCKQVFKDAFAAIPTTKSKETIAALGHAWSEWERKDDDQHALYCVRCWESHIAAHAYETVTINGVEHSICSVCGCTKNTEDQAFTWINYYASAHAKEGTVPYARFAVRMRDNPFKDDTSIVRAFTAVFEKDGSVLKMDEGSIAQFTIPMYLDNNTQGNFTLYRVDKDENGENVLTAIEATYFSEEGVLQFETDSTGLFLIQAN